MNIKLIISRSNLSLTNHRWAHQPWYRLQKRDPVGIIVRSLSRARRKVVGNWAIQSAPRPWTYAPSFVDFYVSAGPVATALFSHKEWSQPLLDHVNHPVGLSCPAALPLLQPAAIDEAMYSEGRVHAKASTRRSQLSKRYTLRDNRYCKCQVLILGNVLSWQSISY